MARIRGVEVSRHLWQDITTEGWNAGTDYVITCVEGLPEGAELVNSFYDGHRRSAVLVFHHESFDDVVEGAELPMQEVVYKQVRRDVWLEEHA